jgi:hypothetical protein
VIEHRFFQSLSGDRRDWLKAKHHFSLNDADAGRRALRAWNDDEIAPNPGLPPAASMNVNGVQVARDGVATKDLGC